jgi:hypothetical protein
MTAPPNWDNITETAGYITALVVGAVLVIRGHGEFQAPLIGLLGVYGARGIRGILNPRGNQMGPTDADLVIERMQARGMMPPAAPPPLPPP